MRIPHPSSRGPAQAGGQAWYAASRAQFLAQEAVAVAGTLAGEATRQGWALQPEQQEEWQRSVSLLQRRLRRGGGAEVRALARALEHPDAHRVHDIVLEYDLRRRGLRVDCLLFAPGVLLVLEFKRGQLNGAAVDQVMDYCASLVEFHEHTRGLCARGVQVVPVLVRTRGDARPGPAVEGTLRAPFQAITAQPHRCDAQSLGETIGRICRAAAGRLAIDREAWLGSRFAPSSTIVDAAISLYGEHDVSAIREHAAPLHQIEACTQAVRSAIGAARESGRHCMIVVSGAPGAGKTLVGLNLTFDPELRDQTVFATGNAALVDVLREALKRSYRQSASSRGLIVASGYAAEHARGVVERSDFKLVKAHDFLGERGKDTGSADGSVLVFDEAQRTYKKGKTVRGRALPDHEADLILQAMEQSYEGAAVVVALLGQNQAINVGEQGAVALFEAAARRGWDFAVSDATLALSELAHDARWAGHPGRLPLKGGHLHHSMRFYRNEGLERWAHHLLEGRFDDARRLGDGLAESGHTIWLTRELPAARAWARRMRLGRERSGIVGSAQARRLAAEGLQVNQKPDIATWMLASSDDYRSSCSLETVQNQYQIQGLELDWAIVCWGADLRGHPGAEDPWSTHKMHGARWIDDRVAHVAHNTYRVLLTRARKGMVIFVPRGDETGIDSTRLTSLYDGTVQLLLAAGARDLGASGLVGPR